MFKMFHVVCTLALVFAASAHSQAQVTAKRIYPSFENLYGDDGVVSGKCEVFTRGDETIKGLIKCHFSIARLRTVSWGRQTAEFRRFNGMADDEIRASDECRVALEGSYNDWLSYLLEGSKGSAGLSTKSVREHLELQRSFCETPSHENKSALLDYGKKFQEQRCHLDVDSEVAIFQYNSRHKAWESQDLLDSRNKMLTYKLWRSNGDYKLQRIEIHGQNKTRPIGPATKVTEYSHSYKGRGVNCSGIFPFITKKVG